MRDIELGKAVLDDARDVLLQGEKTLLDALSRIRAALRGLEASGVGLSENHEPHDTIMEEIASRLVSARQPIWERDLLDEMAKGRPDAPIHAGQIHKSLQLNSQDVPRSSRIFVMLDPVSWREGRLIVVPFKPKAGRIPVWKQVPENLVGLRRWVDSGGIDGSSSNHS